MNVILLLHGNEASFDIITRKMRGKFAQGPTIPYHSLPNTYVYRLPAGWLLHMACWITFVTGHNHFQPVWEIFVICNWSFQPSLTVCSIVTLLWRQKNALVRKLACPSYANNVNFVSAKSAIYRDSDRNFASMICFPYWIRFCGGPQCYYLFTLWSTGVCSDGGDSSSWVHRLIYLGPMQLSSGPAVHRAPPWASRQISSLPVSLFISSW